MRLNIFAAATVVALGVWSAGVAHAAAPASHVAGAMPSGLPLVDQVDGKRWSQRHPVRRSYHRRGPACWYQCHWHGPIKHCATACR